MSEAHSEMTAVAHATLQVPVIFDTVNLEKEYKFNQAGRTAVTAFARNHSSESLDGIILALEFEACDGFADSNGEAVTVTLDEYESRDGLSHTLTCEPSWFRLVSVTVRD